MSIFAAAIAPPQAGPRAAGALRVLSSARASAISAPTCARAPSRRAISTMRDDGSGSEQYPAAGLAWDIETTGIDTNVAEIVQLAVVCANSARNASFSAYVMPEGEVDPEAAAVHGLTKDRLRELGAKPLGDVWTDCLDWIGASFPPTSPLVWAAHNGDRFDRPVLTRCLADAALPPPRAAAWLDTLTLARSALPGRYGKGSYTLTRLHADSCGAGIEGAHDALADAQALSTVRARTRPHTRTPAEGTSHPHALRRNAHVYAMQVWRWLVEEASADARRPETFQAHLQYAAYPHLAPPPQLPADLRPARRATRSSGSIQPSAEAPSVVALSFGGSEGDATPMVTGTELEAMPGVGPHIASRLRAKGIADIAALEVAAAIA